MWCVCVCARDGRQTPMCGIRYHRYLCFVNRIQVFACKWCCQEYGSSGQHARPSVWRSLWLHFCRALKRDHASFASILVCKKKIYNNLVACSQSSYLQLDSFWAVLVLRTKESFKFVASLAAVRLLMTFTSASYNLLQFFCVRFVAVGFPLFIGIDRFSERKESPTLIKKNCPLIYFPFFDTTALSWSCSSTKFADRKKERGKRDDK